MSDLNTWATRTSRAAGAPRAAAVAGIVFSLLLIVAIVLVREAVPGEPDGGDTWLTSPSKRTAVLHALNLLPFAGIAFLWFIAVLRERIGERGDRFVGTVVLGSGLLFIAMMLGAAASAGSLMLAGDGVSDLTTGLWPFGRRMTYTLLTVYGMRMAAVFTISATTILGRLRLIPRWLVPVGFACGAVLLVAVSIVPWLELVFPTWVLVLSVSILTDGATALNRD